jgi:murein DD-endopeptidase MepM/ murein hydrolase activator NlpD
MPDSPVVAALKSLRGDAAPVVDYDLTRGGLVVFDFTAANSELSRLDINDVAGFTDYLFDLIAQSGIPVGIGRYDEDRVLYRHSPLFDGTSESRTVHLGIDLFVAAGTEIRSPLPATVQSLANNEGLGDYGPTVILRHEIDGLQFFTLYGHNSRSTLDRLSVGQSIDAGQTVAEVGDLHENGSWPPHLHFQIVAELPDGAGDFPGVSTRSERERFLELCPDPNLILGIPDL